MEFQGFPKIKRLDREIIITEKIDGTNAQIAITFDSTEVKATPPTALVLSEVGPMYLFAGSRNRWITPDDDNFGFAAWVADNCRELAQLGPGRHFGEWWGTGIQRGYGLKERRFSLFNTERWANTPLVPCCSVVPVLYKGTLDVFDSDIVGTWLSILKDHGSLAAPGYMNPEGVIVYHTAANVSFKKTFDDEHKSGVEASYGELM